MRKDRHDHAGTAKLAALYERIARRLGVPHAAQFGTENGFTAAEIARHMTWFERAERAELQLGRDGSWAHDANRLLALRQARELARQLTREPASEPASELACQLARRQPALHRPALSPSRGSFPPARGGQAH